MSAPASAVLKNAAELMETRGWCQRRYYSDSGECCIVGAVAAVVLGYDDGDTGECRQLARVESEHPAMDYVLRVIDPVSTASNWNDRIATSQTQVVAKLREAAALAESEGR